MLDPLKLKRYILIGIKVLIVLEVAAAIGEGVTSNEWSRLGSDLVIAGVLFFAWGRIKNMISRKRQEYRKTFETAGETLRLRDALAFSLLWTEEIYAGIPKDRLRLVLISYTLIGISILVAFFGESGFMPLIIAGALVLAAVNLLAWVVSAERGEKDTLQTELQLARDVQLSLMPTEDPVVRGFDIAGRSIPAKEVGGDHFTYAGDPQEQQRLNIAVFDVSGKGMQAAMSAVFISGAFSREMGQITSPAAVLSKLNRAVYANSRRGHFITFLLASIDTETGAITFANAGQLKPLLLSNGGAQWLNGTGVNYPLGMVAEAPYQDYQVTMNRGDSLFLMTDGITEAMNRNRELFGAERIEELAETLHSMGETSTDLIDSFVEAVRTHMNGSEQHDDMTMVVVRRLSAE